MTEIPAGRADEDWNELLADSSRSPGDIERMARDANLRHAAVLRRVWWSYLAFGLVATVTFVVLPILSWTAAVAYNAVAIGSVVAILVGVRLHRPAHRRMWYLFAVGLGLSAIAELIWTFYAYILRESPYPSAADVFYVAAYPFLAAGMYALIRGRTSGRDRAGLIDAAIVSAGITLLAWTFVLRPIALDTSLEPAKQVLSMAYPAGDVLLLAMLVRLLVTPGSRTVSYRLLVTTFVLVLIADVLFSAVTATGSYLSKAGDGIFLIYYTLFGATALHPSMRVISETAPDQAPRMTRTRFAVLTSASLLAPLVLAVQGLADPDGIDWSGIAVGAVVLFVLVLLRLWHLIGLVQDQATQLATLARNDPLTGVPNRRAWDLELARELARAQRYGDPVVACIIDLDRFKQYNDTYGHQAGDLLLKEAAAAWRSELRAGDLLARYGGEEFGVLLPGASVQDAVVLLERMRARTPNGRTFSAGVAAWVVGERPESLVNRADEALYQAKRDGRDRVVVHGTPSAPRVP